MFHSFIYTDNAIVSPKTVLPLMYAGKRYQLPKLINECQRILQANISIGNVCVILDQAVFFNELELVNKSVEFIAGHIDTVLRTDAFLGLTQEALRYIVSSDKLHMNETVLYHACLRWADAQRPGGLARTGNATDPVLRENLGDVLYYIRFPTMTLREFATIAGHSDVLSCGEKSSIYYYIATGGDNRGNNTVMFDQKPRLSDRIFDRFGSIVQAQWGCNYPDVIMFTVDKVVTLTAIGTYLPSQANGPLMIDVSENQITYNNQMSSVRVGGTTSFTVSYSSSGLPTNTIVGVTLDQRIQLKAGVSYTINQRAANGAALCYRAYGQGGSASYNTVTGTSVGLLLTISASTSISTKTSVAQGQIPRLYYFH